MRELKKEFEKYGDNFTQVYKKNGVAIYKRSNEHYDDVFEIFKIRIGNMHPLDKNYDPTVQVEKYPLDEAFGDYAWCVYGFYQLYTVLTQKLNFSKDDVTNIIECIKNDSL